MEEQEIYKSNAGLEMIIMVGLPASGKTTWAKDFCNKNDGYVRINRDDIRSMLGIEYSKRNERLVRDIEISNIITSLKSGYSVVVDDTNLNEYTVNQLKVAYFENVLNPQKPKIKFIECPVDECIERDSKRENPVGYSVILEMNMKLKKTCKK